MGGLLDHSPEEMEEHDHFLGHQEQGPASRCQIRGLA